MTEATKPFHSIADAIGNVTVSYLREFCVCAGLNERRADRRFLASLEEIGVET
jgi:hypothetical protein